MGRRKLEPGVNDLATTNPELVLEWDYEDNKGLKDGHGKDISTPDKVLSGAHYKVSWVCKNCNHKWKAIIYERSKGHGCPICSQPRATKGVDDLATTHPKIAAEWHPTKNIGLTDGTGFDISTPDKVSAGSHQNIIWLCPVCQQEWKSSVYNRAKLKRGCPFCSGRHPIPNVTDLVTTNPEVALEWDPNKNGDLIPKNVKAGSSQKVWWKCEHGHEWSSRISDRAIKGCGCPYCAGKKVCEDNNLAKLFPRIADEWHSTKNAGLTDKYGNDISTPDKVTTGSKVKIYWVCSVCGYEWQTAISNRTQGKGCPECARISKTSFPEKAIFYYTKKNFPDAILDDRTLLSGKELDIYIPSIKTGIEYDGEHYHQNADSDIEKNKLVLTQGVKLIRVRERGCPPLTDNLSECIIRENSSNKSLELIIKSVLLNLGISCGDIDIKRDYDFILREAKSNKKKKSLSQKKPDIAAQWHPTLNGSLTPDMVNYTSKQKAWWICDKGHEWESQIYTRARYKGGCPICYRQRGSKKCV